ncbi:aspartate kinase [Tuberibacillus sp. Marseille-P3662]|uniref:aspartate kinase n=1 Tax=Tuberibacillus sp. Marseille-P3662 TaxID=1965358 RepID=UPI000A1C8DE8|nr:aspartate kinase [Tuberibacillus sp. Marseille-P3662]
MKVIVQKFGGTSVKTHEDRLRAVNHVQNAVNDGYKVVAVVSAMGRSGDPYATDTLLSLYGAPMVNKRETDLLMSCGETISSIVFSGLLNSAGLTSEALTGGQAGFRTSEKFSDAKIIDMKPERVHNLLKDRDVVVVAGFQGQSKSGEVTTIGRGGSDTSATALGAALNAEWVDIFTDVEGVMTADPRMVGDARQLTTLTYNEVSNLAYQGAKVIHPRAVEIAMQADVPIRIRSTYSNEPGTLVTAITKENDGRDVQDRLITGIAYVKGVTQIKVDAKEGEYDLQQKVFKSMAAKQISVDFFNISPQGVIYTVMDDMAEEAIQTLTSMGYEPQVTKGCAKVSAVGAGMTGIPGVTAKIVNALTDLGIQILQSADSHTTIWVLIKNDRLQDAVQALHATFELEKDDHERSLM